MYRSTERFFFNFLFYTNTCFKRPCTIFRESLTLETRVGVKHNFFLKSLCGPIHLYTFIYIYILSASTGYNIAKNTNLGRLPNTVSWVLKIFNVLTPFPFRLNLFFHIYIYIYIYRERERERFFILKLSVYAIWGDVDYIFRRNKFMMTI